MKGKADMSDKTMFSVEFGTIRVCRKCGCLVAGGPTACGRCAEDEPGMKTLPAEEWRDLCSDLERVGADLEQVADERDALRAERDQLHNELQAARRLIEVQKEDLRKSAERQEELSSSADQFELEAVKEAAETREAYILWTAEKQDMQQQLKQLQDKYDSLRECYTEELVKTAGLKAAVDYLKFKYQS